VRLYLLVLALLGQATSLASLEAMICRDYSPFTIEAEGSYDKAQAMLNKYAGSDR
jgi:hypothetical protein